MTLITVGGIALLLEVAQPNQPIGLLGLILLSTLVPAYWTSRRVIEIDENRVVSQYLWIMGRQFLRKVIGNAAKVQLNQRSPRLRASLSLVLEEEETILPLLSDLDEERLQKVSGSLQAIDLPVVHE